MWLSKSVNKPVLSSLIPLHSLPPAMKLCSAWGGPASTRNCACKQQMCFNTSVVLCAVTRKVIFMNSIQLRGAFLSLQITAPLGLLPFLHHLDTETQRRSRSLGEALNLNHFHWEQSHLTRHCKDVPSTSWNKIISRGAHTREEPAGPPAVDGKEGGRCLIRQENVPRAKTLPKHFLSPHSRLLRWEPLWNQKVGIDEKLEPTTGWLYIQMQHNHEKTNVTPREGFPAETGSVSIAQQEYWQEYQLQHYWSLVRKDALKWKQVQRRTWVMGWRACLHTAEWKRM